MSFCSKCGAPLEPGASFCTSCGNRMEAAPPYQAPPVYNTATVQQPYQPGYGYQQPAAAYGQPYGYQPKRSKTGLIIGIIAAAAVVITGILLFVFLLPGGANIDPQDLSGSWSAHLTIEKVTSYIKDYDGLDSAYVGEKDDYPFRFSFDKSGSGTLSLSELDFPATFMGGHIKAEGKAANGATFSIDCTVTKDKDRYTMKGTFKFTDGSKQLASGSMAAELD